jgi:hypothetical protein
MGFFLGALFAGEGRGRPEIKIEKCEVLVIHDLQWLHLRIKEVSLLIEARVDLLRLLEQKL